MGLTRYKKGAKMGDHVLVQGWDVFPVRRERDGVEVELFHARGHFLRCVVDNEGRAGVEHLSSITGPPRKLEDALGEVEFHLENGAVPGAEMNPRLVDELEMLPVRVSIPRRDQKPTQGRVVGHVVAYEPHEQGFRPQMVEVLMTLITGDDGKSRTFPVRVRPPGSEILPPGSSPAGEVFYRWSRWRAAFPVDSIVAAVPRNGHFILGTPLPEEVGKKESVEVLFAQLATKFSPRA